MPKNTTVLQLIQGHEYKPERLQLKHLQCGLNNAKPGGGFDKVFRCVEF